MNAVRCSLFVYGRWVEYTYTKAILRYFSIDCCSSGAIFRESKYFILDTYECVYGDDVINGRLTTDLALLFLVFIEQSPTDCCPFLFPILFVCSIRIVLDFLVVAHESIFGSNICIEVLDDFECFIIRTKNSIIRIKRNVDIMSDDDECDDYHLVRNNNFKIVLSAAKKNVFNSLSAAQIKKTPLSHKTHIIFCPYSAVKTEIATKIETVLWPLP